MMTVKTLADVQRDHILAVLTYFKGNRSRTAKALAISIRCLRMKLSIYKEQGFYVPKFKGYHYDQ